MNAGYGRVVRGGSAVIRAVDMPNASSSTSSSITHTGNASTRCRTVQRERVDAMREAKRLLTNAQEQAEKLVLEAQQQATRIREVAEQQGLESARAKLATAWLRLELKQTAIDEASLDRTITIGRLLAERLLHASLQIHPAAIVDMAKDAMGHVWRSERVVMYAHPDDVEPLREHLDAFCVPSQRIEIVVDSDRSRGCLRYVTDGGDIDGDIVVQLDRLVAAIREEVGARQTP